MNTSRALQLIACTALVHGTVNAVDRVVDIMIPGAYATITAALTAAVDGDRIVVLPGSYAEPDLIFNKSVEMVCNTKGAVYTVIGDLRIQSAYGRTITISGADLYGTLYSGIVGPANTGCTLNLLLCSFDFIDLAFSGIVVNAFRCTIRGQFGFSQGTLAGNVIKGDPQLLGSSYSPLLFQGAGTTAEVHVVGNVIGSDNLMGNPTMVWIASHAPLHFTNNLVHWTHASPSASAIHVTGDAVNGITTAGITLLNNTIMRTSATTHPWLTETVPDNEFFVATLSNNFIVGGAEFVAATGTANVFNASFNVITSNFAVACDPQTGIQLSGSPAINAGDPDVSHLDLDLSRNDAGCFGGSFSRYNFNQSIVPGAFVGLVFAPRRSGQFTPMPFTAIGFDR